MKMNYIQFLNETRVGGVQAKINPILGFLSNCRLTNDGH